MSSMRFQRVSTPLVRLALSLSVVLIAGCWPPVKFSGGAGGSIGGARVTERHGRERTTEDVAATQLRFLVVPTAIRTNALERRFDVAVGWEGEWLYSPQGSPLLRQGMVAEATWFAVTSTPSPGVRWRLGPSAEVTAYQDGRGALLGIAAEYAFDKWMVASRPDAGRRMIGGIAGEMSIGLFLRGGVRKHEIGERDTILLFGAELELPGFCFICGLSGGDR